MALNPMDAQSEVDARGLLCPQPVLRARLALDGLDSGQVLRVLATDPHAELDLEVFCATSGHRLVARQRVDEVWEFLLRKG